MNSVGVYCLHFGVQTPKGCTSLSVFNLGFVHFSCKSHHMEELLLLTGQRGRHPPMNFQRMLFWMDRANFRQHEWVCFWLQASHDNKVGWVDEVEIRNDFATITFQSSLQSVIPWHFVDHCNLFCSILFDLKEVDIIINGINLYHDGHSKY